MLIRKILLASLALMAAFAAPTHAQDWPQRPVKIIVPFAPGGNADGMARIIGQRLGEVLGQQFVVENRTGAGGTIAVDSVVRSPADGYTLLWGVQPQIVIIPHMQKVNYDPVKDLAPISVLATYPLIILLRPTFPASNLREFIDYARANPGKVNYGNAGVGNTGQLLAELMMMKADFKMTAVMYRGSAPSINDLLAGTIDMVPDYLLANKGNIDAGKLKFIAVASEQRLKDYPNVPTVSETLPGVTSVAVEDREQAQVLTIQSPRGLELTGELPRVLDGAQIGRVSTREPTLEDAYVALVTEAES